MKSRKIMVLHPFLIAIFPVLFLYAKNSHEVYFWHFFPLFAIILALTFFLWFLLGCFIKSKKRLGMILSAVLFFTFSYGHFAAKTIAILKLSSNTHAFSFLLIWLLLFGAACYVIYKIKNTLVLWTTVLNAFAICLIVLNGVTISTSWFRERPLRKIRNTNTTPLYIEDSQEAATNRENSPNIYYLIFDEHVGSQGLRISGYDNSSFINELKERGFFVAQNSYSNYICTPLSISSSLNYSYLDSLSRHAGPNCTDMKKVYPLLDTNRVFRFLKKQGYQTIYCPTDTFFYVHKIASADLIFNQNNSFIWNSISLEILRNTPFFRLIKNSNTPSGLTMDLALHRSQILRGLQFIKKTKERPGPFVLFAHILSPHFPPVFDEEGKFPGTLSCRFDSPSWMKYYLSQMKYIDKEILDIIDCLQKDAETQPIIIIQGDHGLKNINRKASGDSMFGPEKYQQSYSILNALYLPDFDTSQLYDTVSPVNTFRIIFNHYFGAHYDLLPDRSFHSHHDDIYNFRDVTAYLKEKEE